MKFFISYKFSGEDPAKLEPLLKSIQKALESGGHTNFCSFEWQSHFEKNNFSNKDILNHCLLELESADTLLAFINSNEKSEGMLLEVGYAYAKKKNIFALIREDVKTVFVEEIANKIIHFKKTEDIQKLLENL